MQLGEGLYQGGYLIKLFLFSFNLEDFYGQPQLGLVLRGPIYSPLRLFYNLLNWSPMLIVPALYANIFLFRKKNAVTTIGDKKIYREVY